jgi:diadenosine tetraphosphate (Ap4A) HIT family hydrolase
MSLRTDSTQKRYDEFKKNIGDDTLCRFCSESNPDTKTSFAHWKILHNRFPYDKITTFHDMLIPKRHFERESEMTDEERGELTKIKTDVLPKHDTYDSVMENMSGSRTMDHYHIHLLRFRPLK